MERDMESAHIERQTEERATERSTKERDTYRTLLEAAIRKSKTKELLELLQVDEDPPLLDRVMSECRGKDNPLHVGALYGNVDFVRGIFNKKPKLTCKLNSEEQSPLHVASERGHLEVVKILSKDADACFIRDRYGMIPLHLAAIQGRVEVLEELVEAEPTTAFILTKSGDPILHLCIKNNKFEALKKLIDKLGKDDPDFLNLRDRDDNTILHLLAAEGNYRVMKSLLEISDQLDVNAKNMDGFTPLQVSLLQNENPLPEFRIRRLLTEAGAESDGNYSLFMGLIENLEIPGSDEGGIGEAPMVVAILMATVAFQARLSPPGGVWQDTTFNNATLPNVTQSSPPPNLAPHYAGKSVMSYVDPSSYKNFSDANDMTFIFSLLVIQLLLASHLIKSRILKIVAVISSSSSLITMSMTYAYSATYISLDKQYLLTLAKISSMWLPVIICFGIVFIFVASCAAQKKRTMGSKGSMGSRDTPRTPHQEL